MHSYNDAVTMLYEEVSCKSMKKCQNTQNNKLTRRRFYQPSLSQNFEQIFPQILACKMAVSKMVLLRGHRISLQKPSETNKISFAWNPFAPLQTNESLHFRLQLSDQFLYKRPFEASSVIFERPPPPPPPPMNLVRFTGLLWTFAMAPQSNIWSGYDTNSD